MTVGQLLSGLGLGDRWVVKLFEPWFLEHYHTERRVLDHLQCGLPVPVPRLHAAEQLEGWGYVVMSRLAGRPLSRCWMDLESADRARIAEQVGGLAAAIHGLPTLGLESLKPSWEPFVSAQRRGCVARHRGHGVVSESLLHEIQQGVEPQRPGGPQVLLHTELTDQNLLVDRVAGRWVLSGLVDFEPSMLGAAEYDLVAAALFVCRGDRALLRRLLESYGYTEPELGPELAERLLVHTLLHRYSHLGFFLEQIHEGAMPERLAELGALFFPL